MLDGNNTDGEVITLVVSKNIANLNSSTLFGEGRQTSSSSSTATSRSRRLTRVSLTFDASCAFKTNVLILLHLVVSSSGFRGFCQDSHEILNPHEMYVREEMCICAQWDPEDQGGLQQACHNIPILISFTARSAGLGDFLWTV